MGAFSLLVVFVSTPRLPPRLTEQRQHLHHDRQPQDWKRLGRQQLKSKRHHTGGGLGLQAAPCHSASGGHNLGLPRFQPQQALVGGSPEQVVRRLTSLPLLLLLRMMSALILMLKHLVTTLRVVKMEAEGFGGDVNGGRGGSGGIRGWDWR